MAGTDTPTVTPSLTTGAGLPDGLILLGTIIVVGAIAEGLYKISPSAGWMFAVLAVIGYIAAGNEIAILTRTIATLTGGNK